jgi:four helix bundle protein
MDRKGFENLQVYRLAERLADAVWDFATLWGTFAKNTVGGQLVRAADSIGANIAEGAGRGTFKENKRYARIARGSLNETRHFRRRAFRRKLLTTEQIASLKPLVAELGPRLNAYINAIGTRR